jgi:hypothetical protein
MASQYPPIGKEKLTVMKAGDLMANYECGEGSISLTPEFNYENSLLKLDVLSDWIYDLQEKYDKARLKLNKEQNKARREMLNG